MRGTLRKDGERFTLRFERSYPHPCEDVWQALLDPASLAEWFPCRIEGERRAGARLRFIFGEGEGPVLDGAISVFEPPRLLEYSWDKDILRWELMPTAQGCRLIFTTTVAERSNAPRDATGWDACLANLDAVLAGKSPPERAGTHFAERYREYIRELGLGAFPAFLTAAGSTSAAELLPNPGLSGALFAGPSGARLGALHATRDADTSEHTLAGDAYILVLEGSYVLRLGGQELELSTGMEFHVPGGGLVAGRVKAGTRLFYALAGARAAGGAEHGP